MATTRLMPLHIGEGRSFSTAIEDIIDYVENPEKTDYGKRKLLHPSGSISTRPAESGARMT